MFTEAATGLTAHGIVCFFSVSKTDELVKNGRQRDGFPERETERTFRQMQRRVIVRDFEPQAAAFRSSIDSLSETARMKTSHLPAALKHGRPFIFIERFVNPTEDLLKTEKGRQEVD